MTRNQRLQEQMEWLVDAPLDRTVKAEALFVEMDEFFQEAPPQTPEDEALLLEARSLMTLFICPLTPLTRRFLRELLDS